MGFDKLSAKLGDRPVLQRSVDVMVGSSWIGEVIVVCSLKLWEEVDLVFPADVVFKRVDGGAERQDSVSAGLRAASLDFVCVHDGARPLVAHSDVDRCISAAVVYGASALAHRVADTIRRGDENGFAAEVVDRDHLWALETPQCSGTGALRDALDRVYDAGASVTDETTALAMAGVRVRLVESMHPNPKITTPSDLELAHALIS